MPRPITPDQVAQKLRNIADRIARSRQPDRRMVARDIRKIMVSVRTSASRLMTSGGEDLEMGDLFGSKALETKIKTYLKSIQDLFGSEFSVRELDVGDDGSGHAVFEYNVPEDPEPKSFVLDWSPNETYSDFLAKLNGEIFGWSGPNEEAMETPEEEAAEGQAGPGPEQMPSQGQTQ